MTTLVLPKMEGASNGEIYMHYRKLVLPSEQMADPFSAIISLVS